jgi:multidrug efflux pump subunit AcrB
LTSLIVLGLLGQTINVMTLGGLALAVGILVDDATVEIENVHRNMGIKGKTLVRAILDGAQQIALPAFVSTLCICIVFVPVLMLSGAAKFLFTPLAMAVVFAMLTSYLLTRTIVPTLVHYLLPAEMALYQEGEDSPPPSRPVRSGAFTRHSIAGLKNFATPIMVCLPRCSRTACWPVGLLEVLSLFHWGWWSSSAMISFHT